MRNKAAIAVTVREKLDLSAERLKACECDRRLYLLALSRIRAILTGRQLKPGDIRAVIDEIDRVLGLEGETR